MRIKKSRITAAVVLAGVVVAVIVLLSRADLRYIAGELVRAPDKKQLPEQITEPGIELRKYSYTELLKDKRVSFDDSLLLINEEYALPQDYIPTLVNYGETECKINITAEQSFNDLVAAVKESCNQDLLIVSGYRSREEQLQTIKEEGEKAAEVNASEHLTGLSFDVCIQYFGGYSFLKSEAGRFINTNCGDYGFIIRYPLLSEKITGIGYEPWHIRYVGLPHSKIISGAKLTLEEYIKYFEEGKLYSYDSYIITRQSKESIKLPKEFESADISEDNTGCYIVTLIM